jgi:ribosome-associated protein
MAWRAQPINEILSVVVDAALDKKAEDLKVLDLTEMGSITDYFVVCHGRSSRQVQAICDNVEERLKKAKVRPGHIEGYATGEWVLMDYVDFVVHVFTQEKRNYYDLDRLWSDAPRLKVAPPARGGVVKESVEEGA